MPRRDGTGPMGQGPMTGRKAGWCRGAEDPRFMGGGGGGGRGRGCGFGRARKGGFVGGGRNRNRFATSFAGDEDPDPAMSKESDLAMLKQQSDALENALMQMKVKIEAMEK